MYEAMIKVLNSNKRTSARSWKQATLLFVCVMCASVFSVFGQNIQVKGVVTEGDTKEPIPGVNISIEGTTQGVISDFDGNYTISAPSNATLVFSFIGFMPQKVAVQGRTTIDVKLVPDTKQLDEVVAIGYGTAKRRDVMGSVSSVSADQLTVAPVASAVEAMTGRMAGVQVTSTEGNPDAEVKIRVRGGGSITGDNTPLFIVDGFPVASINDIAPSDIESIDILKDASSTAIYGARGANGVVIVTTKSGKAGKFSVNYSAYYGVKKIAKTLDVLEPYDYVKWMYELSALRDEVGDKYENYFGNFQDMDLFKDLKGNDWQEQVFGRTGTSSNNSLSINGGSELIKYSFSYSRNDDKAIMLGSDFRRDNMNLKLNSNPHKKVALDFSVRYSKTKVNGAGANAADDKGTSSDSRLKHAVIYTPLPLKGVTPEFDDEDTSSDLVNPLLTIADNDRQRIRKNWNMSGAVSYEVIKNMKLKTEIGLDDYNQNDNRFYGLTTYFVKNNVGAYVNMPAAVESNVYRESLRNTNTLYYDFKSLLSQNHSLNALIGQEHIVTKSSNTNAEAWGLPTFFNADLAYKFMSSGTASVLSHFYNPDDKLLSFFGRVNYDFRGKYSFTTTFRADGSSKFADGNRWGYFPSAAVAWRLSEEEFMKTEWLDNLKIRFSYGTAGNNNIPANQMSKTFAASSTPWINQSGSYWSAGTVLDNPDLKWETTYTRNLGIDYGLFRSRLSGSVELYLNNTKDLLMNFNVSGSGYNSQYRNIGETENRGVELSTNFVAIDKKDYGVTFNFNIGFNKNKIKSMGVMEDYGTGSNWASTEINQDYWISKGGSVGDMYGFVTEGRYEVSDFDRYDEGTKKWVLKEGVANNTMLGHTVRPGDLKLKDMPDADGNYDGKVDVNDRRVIGSANPLHTGGFSINGRYKAFDLNANFNWVYGNKIYNANKIEFTSTRKYSYRNMISEMAEGKRWTNLNPDGTISNDPATLEAMNANTTMWSPYMGYAILHSWAVEDGSFLRLSTLSLGYTIPKSMTDRVKIDRLRFYVTGYNVFLLTNYSGYDPEVDTRRATPLTPGVDYSAYPKSRQIVFGLNLNF